MAPTSASLLASEKAYDVRRISEAIRSLSVIACDNCKTEKAMYDVYVESAVVDVKFLRRLCEKCLKLSNSCK